jgi:hypothetical protein
MDGLWRPPVGPAPDATRAFHDPIRSVESRSSSFMRRCTCTPVLATGNCSSFRCCPKSGSSLHRISGVSFFFSFSPVPPGGAVYKRDRTRSSTAQRKACPERATRQELLEEGAWHVIHRNVHLGPWHETPRILRHGNGNRVLLILFFPSKKSIKNRN